MKLWKRIVLTLLFGMGLPVLLVSIVGLIVDTGTMGEGLSFSIGFGIGIVFMMNSILIFKPFD